MSYHVGTVDKKRHASCPDIMIIFSLSLCFYLAENSDVTKLSEKRLKFECVAAHCKANFEDIIMKFSQCVRLGLCIMLIMQLAIVYIWKQS